MVRTAKIPESPPKETQVLVTEKTYEVDKADFLIKEGWDQSYQVLVNLQRII